MDFKRDAKPNGPYQQEFQQTFKKGTVTRDTFNGGPPLKSSISDIVDRNERDAVFRSSHFAPDAFRSS